VSIGDAARELARAIAALPDDGARVTALNEARTILHEVSPLRHHPIDLILWVPAQTVEANDYNPNTIAPPEMKLLERSIAADGYTQPVVTWLEGERRETVDGFHRGEVGRSSEAVRHATLGYLPVTTLGADRTSRDDRIAATIRHNRARGEHRVDAMSDIVRELVRRNRSDAWIAKELGMEPDEVLRLKQMTGLAELFASREFSEAWEPEE
jgi:ParB-like chromosome segregation protein Spo0J